MEDGPLNPRRALLLASGACAALFVVRANALGIKIPQTVLLRAARVIE